MRLGFQQEQHTQGGWCLELAGFQLDVPAPVAQTVAFGKSPVFCLENVAVGLDCHEMPGEGEGEKGGNEYE